MRISWESRLIVGVCVVDLLTTLWIVHSHGGQEYNPVMRFYLDRGTTAFILAKFLFVAGPLTVLEWARRHRPAFVRGMLRTGLALYVVLYGIVVWKVNTPSPEDREFEAYRQAVEMWAATPVSPAEAALYQAQMPMPVEVSPGRGER